MYKPEDPLILVLRPEAVQVASDARVDSFVKIEGGDGVIVGECVHISSFCHVNVGGGKVTMGAHSAMASGSKIIGGTNAPEGLSMSAASPKETQSVERKHTIIGAGVLLGTNAVVMAGVTIGEYAVVAAGSVVTKDVGPNAIVAGVPAKQIAWRLREGDQMRVTKC